jgi:hypothetical protein
LDEGAHSRTAGTKRERECTWTEGKEACVLIDVTGVKNYAKPA